MTRTQRRERNPQSHLRAASAVVALRGASVVYFPPHSEWCEMYMPFMCVGCVALRFVCVSLRSLLRFIAFLR